MAVIITPVGDDGKISQQSILVQKSSPALKLLERLGWSIVLMVYIYLGYFGIKIFWAVM